MLRIEASTFSGERAVLITEGFSIGDEENLYKLTCGQVVEDALSLASSWFFVDGNSFSTRDMDNDGFAGGKCSKSFGGNSGSWYGYCNKINFNGQYPYPGETRGGGGTYSLEKMERVGGTKKYQPRYKSQKLTARTLLQKLPILQAQ